MQRVLLAGVALMCVVSAASAQEVWGAVAVGEWTENGRRMIVGYVSVSKASKAEAESDARRICNGATNGWNTCQIMDRFRGTQCKYVAVGRLSGSDVSYGIASNRDKAFSDCRAGGYSCTSIDGACQRDQFAQTEEPDMAPKESTVYYPAPRESTVYYPSRKPLNTPRAAPDHQQAKKRIPHEQQPYVGPQRPQVNTQPYVPKQNQQLYGGQKKVAPAQPYQPKQQPTYVAPNSGTRVGPVTQPYVPKRQQQVLPSQPAPMRPPPPPAPRAGCPNPTAGGYCAAR
jgi:hypothetical protein